MNIVIDPKTFNETNLFFLDKKKNNIIDGYFSKIIYSSDVFIMNGIFILLPFVIRSSDRGPRLCEVHRERNTLLYDDNVAIPEVGTSADVHLPSAEIGSLSGERLSEFRGVKATDTVDDFINTEIANWRPGSYNTDNQNQTSSSYENKHTIYFYTHHLVNLQYITILSDMENTIINTYKEMNGVKKNSNLGLSAQLHKGYFKIYKERKHGSVAIPKKYMLKISGVWENITEVGITYKFLEIV